MHHNVHGHLKRVKNEKIIGNLRQGTGCFLPEKRVNLCKINKV